MQKFPYNKDISTLEFLGICIHRMLFLSFCNVPRTIYQATRPLRDKRLANSTSEHSGFRHYVHRIPWIITLYGIGHIKCGYHTPIISVEITDTAKWYAPRTRSALAEDVRHGYRPPQERRCLTALTVIVPAKPARVGHTSDDSKPFSRYIFAESASQTAIWGAIPIVFMTLLLSCWTATINRLIDKSMSIDAR